MEFASHNTNVEGEGKVILPEKAVTLSGEDKILSTLHKDKCVYEKQINQISQFATNLTISFHEEI